MIKCYSPGKVDKSLAGLLEDFFDEKKPYLKDWCDLVVSDLPHLNAAAGDVSILTAANRPDQSSEDDVIFLLGSWKTFLIIASKVRTTI